MAEHAQGEWKLWTSCSWRRIRTERGEVVCMPVVASDGHPDLTFGPKGEANVALILAAPAMLEALEGAQARLCEARCMKHEELATSHIAECNQARAAIAQAKGGK